MTEKNRLVFEALLKTGNFSKGVTKIQSGFKKLSNLATGLADETEASLNKMSQILRRNTSEMKKGAVSFQAFFTGLGFASKASSQMSVDLQKMSVDLASFFGIADANAQKRFLAALAGSPEVLDQFGINLKQAALQVELYNMGIKTTVQNTSERVKTTARLAIIMRSMSSAGILGDALRSLDTYAGKMKALDSAFLGFKQTVGKVVIPVIIKLSNTLLGLFKIINAVKNISNIGEALFGKQFKEAKIKEFKKELEQVKIFQRELNILIRTNVKIRDASRVLSKDELKNYIVLVQKEEELLKLLEDDNLEQRDRVLATEKYMFFTGEVQKLQVRIDESLKKQIENQEELNKLKQKSIDLLLSEEEQIKDRYQLEEEARGFNKKDSLELKNLISLQKELLPVLNQQQEAGAITSEQYGTQLFRLVAMEVALENVLKLEGEIARKKKREGEQKEIAKPVSMQGRITRKFDVLNMPTGELTDQSVELIDALMKEKTMIDRAKEIMDNVSIALVDVVQGKFSDTMRTMVISLEQIAMPFINASMQLFDQMLTPPDSTLSKEEQAEQTKKAYAGVIVGLGQAMMAIGQGMVVIALGLKTLTVNPIAGGIIGAAMIGMGAALVKTGKGKLQDLKSSAHSRDAGGGANGGSGVGGFSGMMGAIQGEQVFRLAGNDLVTALNRTNTFQGSIGG